MSSESPCHRTTNLRTSVLASGGNGKLAKKPTSRVGRQVSAPYYEDETSVGKTSARLTSLASRPPAAGCRP
jgi:hypothetical protein